MINYQQVDLDGRHRVFVAGDLHGRTDLLNEKLAIARYNPERDVLVLLGDMVNRGPDSQGCVDLLDRDDVYAVRGNHEEIIIDAYMEPDNLQAEQALVRAGGQWFLKLDRFEQRKIYDAFITLPVALEVITPKERSIGFTHAAVPEGNWKLLSSKSAKREAFAHALRDRAQARDAIQWVAEHRPDHTYPAVTGIDHVFHGHTIVQKPMHLSNRSWIDTGAYKTNHLTVIDIDALLTKMAVAA